jgi:hypothetical protein
LSWIGLGAGLGTVCPLALGMDGSKPSFSSLGEERDSYLATISLIELRREITAGRAGYSPGADPLPFLAVLGGLETRPGETGEYEEGGNRGLPEFDGDAGSRRRWSGLFGKGLTFGAFDGWGSTPVEKDKPCPSGTTGMSPGERAPGTCVSKCAGLAFTGGGFRPAPRPAGKSVA